MGGPPPPLPLHPSFWSAIYLRPSIQGRWSKLVLENKSGEEATRRPGEDRGDRAKSVAAAAESSLRAFCSAVTHSRGEDRACLTKLAYLLPGGRREEGGAAAEAAVSPIIGKKRGSGEGGKLLRRRSVGTTHARTDRTSERVSDWTDLSTFGKARERVTTMEVPSTEAAAKPPEVGPPPQRVLL